MIRIEDRLDLQLEQAIPNASGRLGSYLPFSIAFAVCHETPSRCAISAWDHFRSAVSTRGRFFTNTSAWPAAAGEPRRWR
jgi:hypothetical protein